MSVCLSQVQRTIFECQSAPKWSVLVESHIIWAHVSQILLRIVI